MFTALVLTLAVAGHGGTAPAPATLDHDAYLASMALAATDPLAAADHCDTILDADLAGECMVFAARARARSGQDGLALCDRVRSPDQAQVCHLELVDAQGLSGAEAVQACGRAGFLRERCLSHAIQRELSQAHHRFPPGQEAQLLAWVSERVEVYGLASTRPDFEGEMAARVIARRRPQHSREALSRDECGAVPDSVCAEVYRVLLRSVSSQQDISAVCARPVTADAVARAGWPDWTDELEPLAQAVWEAECRDRRGSGGRGQGSH